MNDNNNSVIPASLDQAVNNLINGPTQAIGETLTDLWNLAFGSHAHLAIQKRNIKNAMNLEKFKKELEDEISKIPLSDVVEPDFQTTSLALENSKYCLEHEELRAMFARLIAASMNAAASGNVHPAFSEIIKQLTPRDASNLSVFHNNTEECLPIAKYIMRMSDKVGYTEKLSNVFISNPRYTDLKEQAHSLSLLQTLGLIQLDYDAYHPKENYDLFLTTKEYFHFQSYAKIVTHQQTMATNSCEPLLYITKGVAQLTPLGLRFKKICIG